MVRTVALKVGISRRKRELSAAHAATRRVVVIARCSHSSSGLTLSSCEIRGNAGFPIHQGTAGLLKAAPLSGTQSIMWVLQLMSSSRWMMRDARRRMRTPSVGARTDEAELGISSSPPLFHHRQWKPPHAETTADCHDTRHCVAPGLLTPTSPQPADHAQRLHTHSRAPRKQPSVLVMEPLTLTVPQIECRLQTTASRVGQNWRRLLTLEP